MKRFNTIIKYTKIPSEDDFSINETECTTLCNDPYIQYHGFSEELIIFGPDVNLKVRARNIYINKQP